jgi:hypothetical protein
MSKVDWKGLVKGVAPTLATALGGPFAGMAVKVLGEKLLGNTHATEDEVAEAVISSHPDKLLELRQIDNDFKLKMKAAGIDLEKVHQADRASARQMAAATSIGPQIGITVLFLTGYFGLITCLLLGIAKVPSDMRDVFLTLIGVLTAGVPQCLNFWLGSSSSSQRKDTAISNAMKP